MSDLMLLLVIVVFHTATIIAFISLKRHVMKNKDKPTFVIYLNPTALRIIVSVIIVSLLIYLVRSI